MDNSKCAVCQSQPCTCSPLDSKELMFDQSGNKNHAVCQSQPCTCIPLDSKELLFDQSGNQNHGASISIMGRVLDSPVGSLHFLGIPAICIGGRCKEKRSDGVLRVVESTVNSKLFGRLDAGNFLVPFQDLAPNGFLLFA